MYQVASRRGERPDIGSHAKGRAHEDLDSAVNVMISIPGVVSLQYPGSARLGSPQTSRGDPNPASRITEPQPTDECNRALSASLILGYGIQTDRASDQQSAKAGPG